MRLLFTKKSILLGLFSVLFIGVALAMPPGPPTGPPACFPPPCSPIPIDGGLSYILIAGLALGGKKVYELNKK